MAIDFNNSLKYEDILDAWDKVKTPDPYGSLDPFIKPMLKPMPHTQDLLQHPIKDTKWQSDMNILTKRNVQDWYSASTSNTASVVDNTTPAVRLHEMLTSVLEDIEMEFDKTFPEADDLLKELEGKVYV